MQNSQLFSQANMNTKLLYVKTFTFQTSEKVKRFKVRTFRYHRLHGNQNSSDLRFEVVYWPALGIGSAVQLAATHWSNEQT